MPCTVGNLKIPIEIPLLLVFFGFILSDSVKTNLIIFRTCYVTFGYNKTECALLGSTHSDNSTAYLEKIVQPVAAEINMAHSLTESLCAAITCLFVGPWSDRFGRKPILITPVIGFMLSYVLYSVFAALENISPWYSLVCSVPVILTGGGASYLTVILCHITDVTDNTNRGMRMGTFEAFLSLGIFLGNISSSFVLTATNYSTVFLISAACCLSNLILTGFFVPESLATRQSEGRLKGLFQVSNVVDMVKTAFKKRQNFQRCTVLASALMLTIFIVTVNGDSAVIFLYLREKFHWSLEKYTLFSAAHSVSWVLGTGIGVYLLHKLLKIPETMMMLVGFGSMMSGHLIMGLAKSDFEIYAAAISRSLGAAISPMIRSLVSKTIPNEDIGKIFALFVASESLFGIAGSPIYTAIYNATLSTDPSIFNFVSAGIYVLEILIAIGLMSLRKIRRADDAYDQLVNEAGEEQEEVIVT